MGIYDRYKRQIQDRIEEGLLTDEYVTETTKRLDVYLSKKKLTQKEYNELIELMNSNK